MLVVDDCQATFALDGRYSFNVVELQRMKGESLAKVTDEETSLTATARVGIFTKPEIIKIDTLISVVNC